MSVMKGISVVLPSWPGGKSSPSNSTLHANTGSPRTGMKGETHPWNYTAVTEDSEVGGVPVQVWV